MELLTPVLDAHNWNAADRAEDILDLIHRSEQQDREMEDAVPKVEAEVREELESKRQEIRRLKSELERTQTWLRARQKKAELAADGLAAHSVPEAYQRRLAATALEGSELRERCASLKEQLTQRHWERSQMRRGLQQAHRLACGGPLAAQDSGFRVARCLAKDGPTGRRRRGGRLRSQAAEGTQRHHRQRLAGD